MIIHNVKHPLSKLNELNVIHDDSYTEYMTKSTKNVYYLFKGKHVATWNRLTYILYVNDDYLIEQEKLARKDLTNNLDGIIH